MSNKSQFYTLSGHITNLQNQPISGLNVQAFDQDLTTPNDTLGKPSMTDSKGKYTILFTEKDFLIKKEEGYTPDVFIRVFDGDQLLGQSDVKHNVKNKIKIDLQVKYGRESTKEPLLRVFGTVRNEFGELLSDVTIKVTDRDLRNEELLGSVVLKDGKYEVRYTKSQFSKVEKDSADVVVRVLDAKGTELFKTTTYYNAPNELEVNINLKGVEYKGLSEWDTLTNMINPLIEGVTPLELREDEKEQDVSFLSGETGRSPLIIGTWIACFHLADKTVQDKMALEAAVFFGFMRQGQPALLSNTLLEDIQHPDRVDLMKDKILKDLSNISPELQKQLLLKALKDNLIPARIQADIDKILEILRQIKLHYAADNTFGAGKGTIAQLLQLTPAIGNDQIKFIAAYTDNTGSMRDFWKKLETDKVFAPEVVRDLKLNFELGALTRNHIPLVAALNSKFKTGEVTAKRDFAKLDRTAWVAIFKSKGPDGNIVGVPANIDGETEDKKFEAYGAILEQRFERSYATTSFMAKLDRKDKSPITLKSDIVSFLDNNPKFHLDRFRLDHYIAENPEALKGVQNKEAMLGQLNSIQRVFKLKPTHLAVDALLAQKIESAQQIYFMGKEQFVLALKDSGINKIESKKIYNKSENAYALALNYLGYYNQNLNGLTPSGIPDVTKKIADGALAGGSAAKNINLPNLQILFGSLDFCECTHCRSVYSPAAHFVDVLRFLGERNTNGVGINTGLKVKDVLLNRRPDLGEMELSCENTNTPLPYIDLVNEVLEDVVASPSPTVLNNAIEADLVSGKIKQSVNDELKLKKLPISIDAEVYAPDINDRWVIRDKQNAYKLWKEGAVLQILPTKQTHLSAAELRANPEYTNPSAYDTLAKSVFPFNLPFNLWQLQSRTYLTHLGVPEQRLFELFQQKLADNITLLPSDLQIDCAWLGIGEAERQILTGAFAGKQSWDFWGLAQTGNNLSHPDTPTDHTTNVTGTWIEVLSHVSIMLHRTGLTYKELLQVLDMLYINPKGVVYINDNPDNNAANCDTTKFNIIGLTQDILDRVHRFIRLWRKLGIQMWELDMLLPNTSQVPNVIDKKITDTCLQDISRMRRTLDKYNWDWRVTLALYNSIDNTVYLDRSNSDAQAIQTLYQSLFRNKLVDATASFPEKSENITGTIADKIPGILAAFRIKEDDLGLILTDLGLANTTVLNITVLSQIYRITLLAKGIGLNIDQFIRLKRLLAINPFADTKSTKSFIEIYEKIAATEFSVLELDYLLAHKYKSNSGIALEDRIIIETLKAIREGLQKVEDELTLKKPEETVEAYIKSKLGFLPALKKDSDQSKALAIVNGTWADAASLNALIDKYFVDVLDLNTAKLNFAPIPPGGTGMKVEDRFAYLQPALQIYLLKTQKESFLKQKMAEVFQIDVPSADLLLSQLQIAGSANRLLQHLNDNNFILKDANGIYLSTLDEAHFPNSFNSMRLLHKNALVLNKLKIKVEELKWWLTGSHAVDMAWVHPKNFPIDTTTSVPMTEWVSISDFFVWKNKLPKSDKTVFEFLDTVLDVTITADTNILALANLTSWDKADITALVANFNWDAKQEFKKSISLIRLSDCMQALRRLGVNAERAILWAKAEPTVDIAESLKQTVKSKYDLVQWQQVIQPFQDIFREQKSDALVSWLISQNNPNWIDTNALYSYFLIDVEMSSCMLTSRLKQGTASAQLFVQRCLLNLELDISVRSEKINDADTQADSKWRQWKWMKYYRLWEANRKVFLYPENWIEPQLRDEKSPFFKELENELMQNDINRDTAEQAYLNYLEKLDKVANLEIRTIYDEVINATESTLHVFGRSRSSIAPEYFYRKLINKGRWTAWEKVELEIAGNHLVAGIHNRRLHLLWPQFLEKALEETNIQIPTTSTGGTTQAPKRYWEIRLFWSELKKGKWTPKVLSNSQLNIWQKWVGGSYQDRIHFKIRLIPTSNPSILAKLFSPFDGQSSIPYSTGGFQKIGKEIKPLERLIETNDWYKQWYYDYEVLIAPINSVYSNGLLNNEQKEVYFNYNTSKETSFVSSDFTPQTETQSILLFNNFEVDSFSVIDAQANGVIDNGSFFLWDIRRTYFADFTTNRGNEYVSGQSYSYVTRSFSFYIHYHPFVELFIKELNIWGIPGLLNRRIQVEPQNIFGSPPIFNFKDYQPTSNVVPSYDMPDKTKSYPVEDIDFTYKGAYSLYNWELFFHTPFHIANKLASNQRFEEALEWYHYIFNPTNTDNTVLDPNTPQQKYWITKPFYETTKADYYKQKIENLLLAIAKGDSDLLAQVEEWRDNPFNPHLIARMRTVAYQKSILIKYIQTIIAWGDQKFRINTTESINEATQLYILADSILGPHPKSIPKKVANPIKTFYQLEKDGIDGFGNSLKEIENLLPSVSSSSSMGGVNPDLPRLDVLYFCIPTNDKILTMWDTVADRLFKIRHCMNIDGIVQQLPLFDPELDPGALVSALAGGADLSSALADLNAPLPLYRFNFMIQKAFEICNEVKSLGAAMLSALEKKDAEAFSILRSNHEALMLNAVRDVKNSQIEEALRTWEGLTIGRKVTEERKNYYTKLGNDGWNIGEKTAFGLSIASTGIDVAIATAYIVSGGLKLIPSFLAGAAGFGGTPTVSATFGGQEIGNSAEMAARTLQSIATAFDKAASLASTVSNYERRATEWDFQKSLAEKELPQIDKQIAAALVRKQIADIELKNHDLQKENLDKELEYMQSKFTNQELYDWMINQISTVYFQSYQLAYDIAKRAERCFRYELGLSDSNYIQYGYWDSLKKGLLSGEKLFYDLKRLESAYYEQNRREYELTKHISVAQLDPIALLKLRQNGECMVDIPEMLFDMDYSGHYFRRTKSVSLSIPCIAGPYTTVACTLTLMSNTLRKDSTLSANKYERDLTIDDLRFRDQIAAIQSIATSSAQHDSGMFELNFRDERYLPFEGAGAIGSWHIQLNKDFPQFNLDTITDVIIHLNYTAREGGDNLKKAANDYLKKNLNAIALSENKKGLFRVYDIKREFSTEWHKFLYPTGTDDQILVMDNLQDRLPYFTRSFTFKKVSKIEVVALAKDSTKNYKVMVSPLGTTEADLLTMSVGTVYQGLHNVLKDLTGSEVDLNSWSIKIKEDIAADFKSLPVDAIVELFLIINYAIT